MAHAVVRTDNMHGTDVRPELISVRFQVVSDGTSTPTAIDNGNIVKLNGFETDSRSVYIGVTPASTDTVDDIVLIATPEVMYDERLHNLDEYENEAGKICRGYRLHEHSMFGLTADGFSGTPQVGKHVSIGSGTKLVIGTGAGIGEIVRKDVVGRYTYYVVDIKPVTSA